MGRSVTDSLGFSCGDPDLCVFSYLLGDNVLFRLAEHLFVAMAVGYAFIVALHQVLWASSFRRCSVLWATQYGRVLLCWSHWCWIAASFKSSRRRAASWFGNLSVAFLLGVGAAVAIAAAVGYTAAAGGGASDITRYVTRYGRSWDCSVHPGRRRHSRRPPPFLLWLWRGRLVQFRTLWCGSGVIGCGLC